MTRKGVRLLQYHPDDALAAPDPRFYTEIAGLMNVTACQAVGPSGHGGDAAGPPLFMSFPHFCYVDPVVAAQTVGTRCDPARHDLWLGVEPITGITMAAAKRLQVSSAFDARYPAFDPAVTPTILPIFWAEEVAEVSDEDAERFVGTLYPVRGQTLRRLCCMPAFAASTRAGVCHSRAFIPTPLCQNVPHSISWCMCRRCVPSACLRARGGSPLAASWRWRRWRGS